MLYHIIMFLISQKKPFNSRLMPTLFQRYAHSIPCYKDVYKFLLFWGVDIAMTKRGWSLFFTWTIYIPLIDLVRGDTHIGVSI